MANRTTIKNFVLVIAILWALAAIIFKEARVYLLWAPLVPLGYIILISAPNYVIFRECKRYLKTQDRPVLSHNLTYSKFDFESKGKQIEVAITPIGRQSLSISLTVAFENAEHRTFILRPVGSRRVTPDHLVLDAKFEISHNTLSSAQAERLLLPVREDLLKSLVNESPSVAVDSRNLVVECVGFNHTTLERNLRMAHALLDSLSREETI